MATFDSIKPGDQVIVYSGSGYGRAANVHTVDRITATQFKAGGIRFTKQGYQVGGDAYWSARAELATSERIAEVVAENKLRDAAAVALRKLEAIRARLKEIANNGGVSAAALHAATVHLQAAMRQLTPQGGEVEG